MNLDSKIYVAGHNGLVGSAILRNLKLLGYKNVVYRSHKELDLTNQQSVNDFFNKEKPEYVFLAAAKVGGIYANDTYSADFIYENILIQTNVIHNAYLNKVKKLLFLGSVCIYPKFAEVPVKEESLLTGMLEPTNDAYAVAKISGIKMCQAYRKQYGCDFISAMPCNLYGINDNFHPTNSHVLPALIRKFHEAKINRHPEVMCWGDGSPRREFMDADDVADACMFLIKNYTSSEIINIGYGKDFTIKEIVQTIIDVTNYQGNVVWDTNKPNGTPKRLLDNNKLTKMGWNPKIELYEGIKKLYNWYINQNSKC